MVEVVLRPLLLPLPLWSLESCRGRGEGLADGGRITHWLLLHCS